MNNMGLESDMEAVMKLDETQRLAFLKAFSHLARADGAFTEDEKKFILDTARLFGIHDDKRAEIIEPYSDEEIIKEVKQITDRRAALELIKELCVLAHSDDSVSDTETLLIGHIGQAMGVEPEKIQQISNWVIDRIIWLEEAKLIFEED